MSYLTNLIISIFAFNVICLTPTFIFNIFVYESAFTFACIDEWDIAFLMYINMLFIIIRDKKIKKH